MKARSQNIIEALETRRLLSGTLLGAGGVLRVWGNDLQTNSITFANNVDGVSLDVTISSANSAGVVTRTITRSFARSAVTSVWVSGGSRNDGINAGVVTVPMCADGRGGNDSITTGGAADVVFAGGGNDSVNSGGGNDRVFGGLGNDSLNTGGGDDRASGGWGDDAMDLGSGFDFGRGDFGNDSLEGGHDNDVLFGNAGNDELFGERDNDTLWGGAGNDALWGGDGMDTLGGVLGANALNGEDGVDTFIVLRGIASQPANDYVLGLDIEQIVTGTTEGPAVPAV